MLDLATTASIAPLDVRVTPVVQNGTHLRGRWDVTSDGAGAWEGRDIKMTESWQRGKSKTVRLRGKASGGPQRVHLIEVNYLQRRTGEGVLTEAPSSDPDALRLLCRSQGAEPGETTTTYPTVIMQVVDQPARNRVVIRGPGVPFDGPECRPADRDLPVRVVGVLPSNARKPWIPLGATSSWERVIPRAEFAAGGTFRFRGAYSVAGALQQFSNSDVFGSGIMTGKVVVDLHVRRVRR